MTSQPVAFCETVRQRYYRSTRSVNFDAFLLLAVAILSRLTSDFFSRICINVLHCSVYLSGVSCSKQIIRIFAKVHRSGLTLLCQNWPLARRYHSAATHILLKFLKLGTMQVWYLKYPSNKFLTQIHKSEETSHFVHSDWHFWSIDSTRGRQAVMAFYRHTHSWDKLRRSGLSNT